MVICQECPILANKKRINSILQGSSLRETSAQYAYIVAGADGQRKRRTEEEVRVRQQATRIGNCCTLCTFAVGPEQNLVRLPRQGVHPRPFKSFPLGRPL